MLGGRNQFLPSLHQLWVCNGGIFLAVVTSGLEIHNWGKKGRRDTGVLTGVNEGRWSSLPFSFKLPFRRFVMLHLGAIPSKHSVSDNKMNQCKLFILSVRPGSNDLNGLLAIHTPGVVTAGLRYTMCFPKYMTVKPKVFFPLHFPKLLTR